MLKAPDSHIPPRVVHKWKVIAIQILPNKYHLLEATFAG